MGIEKSMDLYQRSIEIILNNQHSGGAYIACPEFPNYQYCWFRDGTFTAYAMDLAGQHESVTRFNDWAARAINIRADMVNRAETKRKQNLPLGGGDLLHTRYTVDGDETSPEEGEWPNFQLDGFGTWLWGLKEHLQMSGESLKPEWRQAASLAARFLAILWNQPCYDCWEEFPKDIHTHTLAAIYGGLRAVTEMGIADYRNVTDQIRQYVENELVYDGYFVKFKNSYTVDASMLGLVTPYRMFSPEDPRMIETLKRIQNTLWRGGGVHRYATDTYYGGGEWVLLAGWMGWYLAENGRPIEAGKLLEWMENQANDSGELPEQVPATLNDPNYYQPWFRRWGEIARPLLWSHAMDIILRKSLKLN
jgi:GH15 family glucan-1,4-alpha-glucosidase